jgi:murein DD-endopeptidase MepM/ murein hydrolase activator NlpD
MSKGKPISFSLLAILVSTQTTSALFLDNFIGKVFAKDIPTYSEDKNIQNLPVLSKARFAIDENSTITDNIDEDNNAFIINKNEQTQSDSNVENTIYTVGKGENVYSIASFFGITSETIISVNKLTDTKLDEGDVLEIPSVSGVLYTIRKGDTLDKIAEKYNIEADDISLFNGLITSAELIAGDDIFLPGAEAKNKKVLKDNNKDDKKDTKKDDKKTDKKKNKDGDKKNITKLIKTSGKYSALTRYSGYYTFPAPGAVRTQKLHGHNGADLAAPVGTPLVAAADGTVVIARSGGWNYGYGSYVVIAHPNGTQTLYGHMSVVGVSVGQNLSKGEKIGKMGSTGNSTGSHVHFEVRGAYNPFAW